MEMFIKGLVGLIAVLFLAMGVLAMFAPQKAVKKYYIKPDGSAGLNTMRSMIGGTFMAFTALLVIGLVTGQTIWFLAVVVFMVTIAFGRILGLLIDGYHKDVLIPLVAEIVIAVVLVAANNQLGAN